ncbi:hypothetical protein BHM03_00054250 [Ensete ventricosum]|nr:hypothetical protein BHM03_00054250 [Ensete ventricosum]
MGSRTNMVSQKNVTVINFRQSRVSIDFSCTVSEIQNIGHSQRNSPWEVACRIEFRSVFRVPSRKFKILVIPDVLAHGKSYEHGFAKKHDGHKLWVKSHAESSFNRFFVYRLENSNYWPFPTYMPMGSRTNMVS